jgi:energy-converting hydrogenase Eha subunit A
MSERRLLVSADVPQRPTDAVFTTTFVGSIWRSSSPPKLPLGICKRSMIGHRLALGSPAPPTRKGGLRRLGVLLLTLSFVSICWTAVRVDGFEPGQILLAVAVVVLGLDALRAKRSVQVPRGMLVGAIIIAVAGLLSAVFPASAAYISTRFDPVSPLGIAALGGNGNLTQLAKFEVALVGVIVAVLLLRPSIAEAKRLAGAWVISALVSAAVAASDASGHTSISAHLLGYVDINGRQGGLSVQANDLAVSTAIALPVLLFWLVHGSARTKVAGAFGLGLVAYSSILAGSRGGFAGMLVAAVLFVLFTPRLRLRVVIFGIPLVLLAGCLAILAFPSVLSTIATDVRFAGDLSAASNIGHVLGLQQGLSDVQQSPIFGIGFDHLTEATEVHLQLLAAGGVLALGGYLLYWFTVIRAGFAARHVDVAFGSALLASVLTFMALNFVENQVANTYQYVAAALLVSVAAMQRQSVSQPAPVSARSAAAHYPRGHPVLR